MTLRSRHQFHSEYLDWMTVRCPRCNRLVPTWSWIATLIVGLGIAAFALLKLLNRLL